MVSLDNFILYDTPHSSCDNSDYIGSPRVRTFTSKFLLGGDRLYERYNGLWVLKSVLVDNTLITDYSFEAVDILEEQILVLSAFDKVVTIQFETLWEYFKLPDVSELNEISRQLTERKIEGYHNPLKDTYYTLLDDGETVLSFEEWEVEMNTLHNKWLFCERSRLTDQGYGKDIIENYLTNRTFKEFLEKFYFNGIKFYSKEVEEDLSFTEVAVPVVQVTAQADYNESLQILIETTGMGENVMLPNNEESLAAYITSIGEMEYNHVEFTHEDVTRHATNVYNYHRSTQTESIRFEDLTDEVMTEEELYRDALQAIADTSGLETDEFLPLSTTSLNDYLDWIRYITDLPEDGVINYGTIIYNHHNGA